MKTLLIFSILVAISCEPTFDKIDGQYYNRETEQWESTEDKHYDKEEEKWIDNEQEDLKGMPDREK